MAALQARDDRDRTSGRFLPGNKAAGTTLARSVALWSELTATKADLAREVSADLDGERSAATLQGLIEAYAEARLLRTSLFIRLSEQGGPITTKGTTRALFTTYLSALDREVKLATTLGLEKKAKPVETLADVLARRTSAAG